MGRVKVSPVRVEDRLHKVVNELVKEVKSDNYAAGYVYACGYLESSLANALRLLPPKKREEFLAGLEQQVAR
jgi:hypothetical protein